jgi:enoyl-CoA hydratase
MTDQVHIFIQNGVGRIRLNRPKAIHALTAEMCAAINEALIQWAQHSAVVAVMIDHFVDPEGDPKLSRGFCAGGDIALLAKSAQTDCVEAENFFRVEYQMNHLLFVYAKPIVAFIDGIVMGGGVGLSLPALYRVATERTMFAMPETGIGLFPDVGGGWFLSRLPGRTGAWLATTGARIKGADVAAIGLATHYMASDKIDTVKDRILADPASLPAILNAAADPVPDSQWAVDRSDIDRLFASDSFEDIVVALEADDGGFAKKQLEALAAKSPQTIKVALRQLAEGAAFTDFADNMRNEYRIACHVIRRPDFLEGVRAVIVDKDNAPRWNPATSKDVSEEMIEDLFASLPAEREWMPLPQAKGRTHEL